jgi:hypothetical protein
MKASVHLYLLCISLLLALPISVQAQTTFPSAEGERAKYAAYIEMPKAYVSGICVLLQEDGLIKGSLFNEFGITALDFTYNPQRDKIKLHSVMKMMDKWYIRKVLKKDLRQVMKTLKEGQTEYTNQRRHIVYRFHGIEE